MILRYRSSALTIQSSLMLLVEHEDPSTKVRFWSVPGGGIERGESEEQAAVRETLEETGYQINLISGSKIQTRYLFNWNNEDYDCHTTWFLAETKDIEVQPVNDEIYLLRHRWFPVNQRGYLLQHHAAILNSVNTLLEGHEH